MDIIKYYKDYIDRINEKFPSLNKHEISQILNYGLKIFNICHRNGLDTLNTSPYYTMYTGKLFNDKLTFYHYWRVKYKKKLRFLYKRQKNVYDGHYYFGMTKKEFEYYQSQKEKRGTRRQLFHYPYVYAYKIKEEAFSDRSRKYFFIIDYPQDVGWMLYKENWTTRRVKYFAYRDENGNIQMI